MRNVVLFMYMLAAVEVEVSGGMKYGFERKILMRKSEGKCWKVWLGI